MIEIETMGTYPKSKLSPKGTNGPLGVKNKYKKIQRNRYFDNCIFLFQNNNSLLDIKGKFLQPITSQSSKRKIFF